jgi:hypothetical protein
VAATVQHSLRWLIALVLVIGIATPARAQSTDAATMARFNWGFLHFTPTVSLSNVGTDSNMFNDPVNPQRDTTATPAAAVSLWLNVGRSLLSAQLSGQYVYYQKLVSQRSLGSIDTLRWELPVGRLKPFVAGQYSTTRNRPNYEIDSRPRNTGEGVDAGASLDLSTRTSVLVSAGHSATRFDSGEVFEDTNLATALNSTATNEHLALRYKLTPLTTFVVDSRTEQDRFTYDPLRNANSITLMPGFELQPAALISGSVMIGFRRFTPFDPTVPPSQGLGAAVMATLNAGSRQVTVGVRREIAFSYLETSPYYLLTDTSLAVTQRITQNWDLIGQVGQQILDYHELVTAPPGSDVDSRVRQYGGGLGYRLGRTLRIGLNATHIRREATASPLRNYSATRIGLSMDYGQGK